MARKILLADDSVTAQNMGRKILADAGYEVITVNNGSAALKRIAEVKPDVIVLDVYMPGYSGLEVCQRLKESNDTARIPILLTVGKLEPFKPEEAKRVRAEAFIVKPFEASELLSALAKLEDKIVPRSDSSKPGRFARAIAAVEEGRYDKSVSIEEDSGWKNRISFPRKKKEKPVEPEDGDDAAIYNAVNRDLKTVVEHKLGHVAQPAAPASPAPVQEETNVDLGALVAHGLPKDVTPEEIAALAAAAAQVQGITESTSSQTLNVPALAAPEVRSQESNQLTDASSSPADSAVSEIKPAVANSESASAEPAVEQTQTALVAPHDAKPEGTLKVDNAKSELQETGTGAPAINEKSSDDVAATFAPEELEQKEETEGESRRSESAKEGPATVTGDALPAIASFASDEAANSANGVSAPAPSISAEPQPVTMAVAAAHLVAASRWTAVAVALAPEETSIALEEEMRKAQAAALAPSVPEPAPLPVEDRRIEDPAELAPPAPVADASVMQTEVSAVSSAEPSLPAIEQVQVQDAAASSAPVVKEFETVTPRQPEPSQAAAEPPVDLASAVIPAAAESVEVPPPVSASWENQINNEATNLPAPPIIADSAAVVASAPAISDAASVNEPAQSEAVAASAEPLSSVDQHQPENASSTAISEPPEIQSSSVVEPEPDISHENDEPAAVAATQEISRGPSEMAKKESEIAATTAAAWASWRRIRETADGKSAENTTENESEPRDEAALAVAAGAEKAPLDASDAEVAPEIANIVDSVLADLRPKIVEEISKKLGKKK